MRQSNCLPQPRVGFAAGLPAQERDPIGQEAVTIREREGRNLDQIIQLGACADHTPLYIQHFVKKHRRPIVRLLSLVDRAQVTCQASEMSTPIRSEGMIPRP